MGKMNRWQQGSMLEDLRLSVFYSFLVLDNLLPPDLDYSLISEGRSYFT